MKASARSSGGSSNTTTDDSRSVCRNITRPQPLGRGHEPRACLRLIPQASIPNGSSGAVVDPLAQVLARLEMRNVLARECHRLAGLGIASLARRAKVQREAAESPDLDALPLG